GLTANGNVKGEERRVKEKGYGILRHIVNGRPLFQSTTGHGPELVPKGPQLISPASSRSGDAGYTASFVCAPKERHKSLFQHVRSERVVASHPGCDHLCARNPASPCGTMPGPYQSMRKCDPCRDHS